MFPWAYFFRADWIRVRLRRLRRASGREFAASRLAFLERRTMRRHWPAASQNIVGRSIAKFRWEAMRSYRGLMRQFQRWTSRAWTELTLTLCHGRGERPD